MTNDRFYQRLSKILLWPRHETYQLGGVIFMAAGVNILTSIFSIEGCLAGTVYRGVTLLLGGMCFSLVGSKVHEKWQLAIQEGNRIDNPNILAIAIDSFEREGLGVLVLAGVMICGIVLIAMGIGGLGAGKRLLVLVVRLCWLSVYSTPGPLSALSGSLF